LPEYERSNAKKRWRLVLERAEKVKKRIEDLGGHVGKVGAGDEVEEEAVMTRGGVMNGVKLDSWREPSASTFRTPVEALERQPELAKEQEALDPEWAPVNPSSWDIELGQSKWVVRQGPGADCSVVAGLGACLEHNRRWNTTVCPPPAMFRCAWLVGSFCSSHRIQYGHGERQTAQSPQRTGDMS